MSEYGTHKAHCFMVVQPENEFMGCKYGQDEDCPIYKEREANAFKQVSKIETKNLEKRTIYDGEQYLDIKAKVTNGEHFEIKVYSSQNLKIEASMSDSCLRALIQDLTLLLEPGSDPRDSIGLPQRKCNGVHCKCMNLDGSCSNFHYSDHICEVEEANTKPCTWCGSTEPKPIWLNGLGNGHWCSRACKDSELD